MGLFGVVRGVGGLVKDVVDGTVDTAVDVVTLRPERIAKRAARTPEQALRRLLEILSEDE